MKGPGLPRTNCRRTVKKDPQRLEEDEAVGVNTQDWLWSVAQCMHMDTN